MECVDFAQPTAKTSIPQASSGHFLRGKLGLGPKPETLNPKALGRKP